MEVVPRIYIVISWLCGLLARSPKKTAFRPHVGYPKRGSWWKLLEPCRGDGTLFDRARSIPMTTKIFLSKDGGNNAQHPF